MLLITLSWLYIIFTTINLGFGLDKIIDLKNKNFVITSILGLFSVTVLGSFWAIFGRINIEFHLVLLVVNIIIVLKFKQQILAIYKSFFNQFKQLSAGLQLYLYLISILIIAQCAAIPFIIDNESYYIQTIKWINEYGFVKGLANLHIFFGQTSGWHITQSVFSFSFLYKNFNDLSGFCLLLGNIFTVFKLNTYFENENKSYLIVGLLPLSNVLLFQFISAPSPDLPVYVFSFIIFFYFIEHFKKAPFEKFNIIVILSLFVLYIKPTAIALLVLPLLFLVQNFKILKPKLFPSFVFGLLILALFVTKNLIITGYPFYPTQLFSYRMYDFGVPEKLVSFYFDETKLYGFFLTKAEFHSMSYFQIFIKWLTINKLNSLFNVISVLLVVISPYFIYKFYNKKAFWYLYFIMVFQLGVLLITSPQFRFFIHFILFFGFFVMACLIKNKRFITLLLFGSSFLVMVLLFFPIKFSLLTKNKLIIDNSRFTANEVIFPYQNSKLKTTFYKMKIGNLNYNSPDENAYFWTNGDGKLPCVNSQQLDYFKKYFHYVPQMKSENLKDGFYSKKISSND
ncbi:hypothetical protein OX283_004260 [Flavobacterium sp. SUN052]|uniref:LIC_10190 family membrane protein n=1 Tax=Flavobacterium sp. SUN052 TaxID=3002441 RepID=UPI00237E5342|nr:hypothetical protein [Flavobacterium sp. SUN052]MEC4003859.1 hypothetical protein [Flavobacterium sp. SUN052]